MAARDGVEELGGGPRGGAVGARIPAAGRTAKVIAFPTWDARSRPRSRMRCFGQLRKDLGVTGAG